MNSSDSYYHLSVPTENSVGSNILCYVKDVNGDSGYRDVMFESSDDSIVEAPKKSIVQPNDAVFESEKSRNCYDFCIPKIQPFYKKILHNSSRSNWIGRYQ